MRSNERELLKAEDVAKMLNISPRTVYAMARAGKIPYVRLGRKILRFDKDDLLKWLNKKKGEFQW